MSSSRVALVTGGARGLGAAIALRLAADGLSVAVLDLDQSSCDRIVDAIRALGARALAVQADVSDEDSVRRAVAACVTDLGPPAVLVNNAGILRDNLLFRMSVADWDDVSGVHLRGAFLMTREVMPHMVEAGWGRVVSVSSTSALGNRGQANYSAAKAGLQGFMKTVAIEGGRFGITANVVAPGFIDTEMLQETARRQGLEARELADHLAMDIPAGRIGTPDDVAAAAAFFASEGAAYVSGQVLYVAGGPVG